MIDGSLGMAYGVSCRSFLKALTGIPPAAASAVIHIAEIPTSLVSGISHFRIGNVDRRVFIMLLFPGVIGGVIGAWTIVGLIGVRQYYYYTKREACQKYRQECKETIFVNQD